MENQEIFNSSVATRPAPSALVEQESQRAVAEVQAAIMLAKRFPRDMEAAKKRILASCQRPGLAEAALYTYAKGGTDITGPSIRLAEVAIQNWGNAQFGIRELDQRNGESTMEAYAWDLETNVREVKVFQVKHERYTKKGSYRLSDPREIYEMTANQGARRLRACIQGIIPKDLMDEAVSACERTMKANTDTGPEGQGKLLLAFEAIGVKKEQIEKRIQRRLDTITPAQMMSMRKIYNSLRDGMSTVTDWFEVEASPEAEKKTGTAAAKEALKPKAATTKPPAEKTLPATTQEAEGPDKADELPGTHAIQCTAGGEGITLGHCRTECQRIASYRDCPDYCGAK